MLTIEIGKIKDIAEIRSRSLKENFDFETFEKLLKVYYRIKFLDNLHFEKNLLIYSKIIYEISLFFL